jgi:putative ABC transport system ATP-binding protein
MLRRATALYSFTGTLSSPKLIEPLQIALAMEGHLPGLCRSIHDPGGSRPTAGAILRRRRWDHAAVLFELRDVSLTRGGRTVLAGVSAAIPAGAAAIVGPSGSGKSTLLRLLNRLADPDSGEIAYRDRSLDGYDPLALRREVALVPQLPALLEGTVESNLRYAAGLAGNELDAPRCLRLAGLGPEFAGRDVARLSVGEQQRAMLGRALAQQPEVLLLDEPTSALDHAARDAIEAALAELRRELEISVVLVTHDPEQARRLSDWVVRLQGGRVVGCGALAEVLT